MDTNMEVALNQRVVLLPISEFLAFVLLGSDIQDIVLTQVIIG